MEIIIVTGKINSGKTTLMRKLADEEKVKGNFPTGIIAPGDFKDGIKIGFIITDLASGKSMLLASSDSLSSGFTVGRFKFSLEAFEFAKQALLNFKPKGIAFLDEVGPLELKGEGYASCLKTLLDSDISKLYICVRQNCLQEFMRKFISANKLKVRFITTDILHKNHPKSPPILAAKS